MILIINVCKDPLHYLEFVKPVEDILNAKGIAYITRQYKDVDQMILTPAKKIIICGTSLKDNGFMKDIKRFSWITTINKPILGICAGMQIIGLLHGGKKKKKTEIGYYTETFTPFLGLEGEQQVYHLHNHYVTFNEEFIIYSKSKIPQAIKHKEKPLYGVLFHPEVRNKSMILEFCNL